MKILFAVQGTGNGHVSRARDIYPELSKYGDVDVLISGIQADVVFPFPVKYRLHGMSFIFGKKGGVDLLATAKKLRLPQLIIDIRNIPVEDYDLIVNDFEPITSWACKLKKIPCIGLSHQSAVLHPQAPRPSKSDFVGTLVLRRYAPVTAYYGFHFRSFGQNIFTPVIRKEVRNMIPEDKGHYTVYLPAYDDDTLVRHLSKFETAKWQVFSKHNKKPETIKNVQLQPIENDAFIKSMAASTGVLCGAGFEGPAEALHLGKKLMVIPMTGQYEQQCNAEALKDMGVPVIYNLSGKYHKTIAAWLTSETSVSVSYPDDTEAIVAKLVKTHARK